MNGIIKIACPNCGAVLAIRLIPGIETKKVQCPVCQNKAMFQSYKIVEPAQETIQASTAPKDPEATEINTRTNYTLGQLLVPSLPPFRLHTGENTIGRKATASTATLQIPLDNKRMSREHLRINVQKVAGKGFVHSVSIVKNHVTPTYINDVQLQFGDSIILQSHDLIHVADVTIEFVIPDDDETEV